ncbi:5531_t:CDS:1, partial [Diversispora eburnea]
DLDTLRTSVKQIVEIIVGLLKDRIKATSEPESKKRRVHEKIQK